MVDKYKCPLLDTEIIEKICYQTVIAIEYSQHLNTEKHSIDMATAKKICNSCRMNATRIEWDKVNT